jgi:molybdopterin/thiamine biosynthesis adenylyltransferase
MIFEARLDRQLRLEGWDQEALSRAAVGLTGDYGHLASWYVLAAAALGINRLVVVAPWLDQTLMAAARRLNPALELSWLEGCYTHPALGDLLGGCRVVVDATAWGLTNKLLLNEAHRRRRPLLRGYVYGDDRVEGFKVFTYLPGREWQELAEVAALRQLPHTAHPDAVLSLIAAGLLLEETKNLLMGREAAPELVGYERPRLAPPPLDLPLGIVGAGALGNLAALGLAYAGFTRLHFFDPDAIEATNLNRQVLFYDAIGALKAETLAARLRELFGLQTQGQAVRFDEDTDISDFVVLFDCVDNFETRLILSEKCRQAGKILISGGAGAAAGQVAAYDPAHSARTPAELLGLADIVAARREEQSAPGPACVAQPDPAVIMTNQIIAGFMVEAFRKLLAGRAPAPLFYDANRTPRLYQGAPQ